MVAALLLAALFGIPGYAVLAAARARGADPWPWPRGVAVTFALGIAMAGVTAILLGIAGWFSASTEAAAMSAITVAAAALGRGLRWPFARASTVEAAGFVIVVSLASALFLGRSFEMLIGGRDATVYLLAGVGLSRQGSLLLHDVSVDELGGDLAPLYPYPGGTPSTWQHWPRGVKYPGFYFSSRDRATLVTQGFPLLPAVIAVVHSFAGLPGAFAATNVVGVVAVASVFAVGAALVGAPAAACGTLLLALDLIEVWAARYPVAEILFQMLLFGGLAAALRNDRLGGALAGFLMGATLLCKVEAAAIVAPIAIAGVVGWRRGKPLFGKELVIGFALMAGAGVAYASFFQPSYVLTVLLRLASTERRVFEKLSHVVGSSVLVLAIVAAVLAAGAALAVAWRSRARLSVTDLRRASAILVAAFFVYAYAIRPFASIVKSGEEDILIWLGWYVSPLVVVLGFAGLVHFLWTRLRSENAFALVTMLVMAALFVQFTFVNVIHIYVTRRFVPALLPVVCLFFGYFVAVVVGEAPWRFMPWLRRTVPAVLAALAVGLVLTRSRHLYDHREYDGLTQQIAALAAKLKGVDGVFLPDPVSRDMLGPALEFGFGIPTISTHWKGFGAIHDSIGVWMKQGRSLAVITTLDLEKVPGTEDFVEQDRPTVTLRVLGEKRTEFPREFQRASTSFIRYAAGPGSDPAYEAWRESKADLVEEICAKPVRIIGGNEFLRRHLSLECPRAPEGRSVFLVSAAEAPKWQETLEVYGVRSVRREKSGFVIFDDLKPQAADRPLSPTKDWKVTASDGRGKEWRALDGDAKTRWGSASPQRAGMFFQIEFPAPVDITWLRVRMGRYATDRARHLAFSTSVDGNSWNRKELPHVVDSLSWQDGVPLENARGDLDLWVDAAGIRFVRLENLRESSRFDWSIADLVVEGRPSR